MSINIIKLLDYFAGPATPAGGKGIPLPSQFFDPKYIFIRIKKQEQACKI